jgi:hypothetical protein
MSRRELDGSLVWQFVWGVVRGDGGHGVDEPGSRWGGVDGELSWLAVYICKVKRFFMDVAEDDVRVEWAHWSDRDGARGARGLHANLMFSSWAFDQIKAAVLSQRMVGNEKGREKALGGDRMGECFSSRWILWPFKLIRGDVWW